MDDLCRRIVPIGAVDAHEAKFARLEETGQATLEVAQEEDAPQKACPEAAQAVEVGALQAPIFRHFFPYFPLYFSLCASPHASICASPYSSPYFVIAHAHHFRARR